ncbi:SDR family NAD(P)-dependent oxidoreductase [Nocardia sp. BMG111209]|uniref:SDR family NAD(P)-dependent oxidoreductase n=1 Tax=Nocardia sp. BMG111209 TaxID=1160137 RepID=UPI00039FA41D|nr:SDR family NAD(P)-dependent oxidoreductase [Nocardia sp. BMG111209]
MAGAVIIGAGPGIGSSVARRFARAGLPIALVARSDKTLRAAAEALEPLGIPVATFEADTTDEAALHEALTAADRTFGVPEVVVYNAAIVRSDAPGQLSVREHEQAWAVNVVGAINTAAHVVPAMAERGSGSFLVTGGMPRAKPDYVSLSLGKAGVRALVELLADRFGPAGVHIASITVDGPVAPGTAFDPDDIAEYYWRLHTQDRAQWEREIVYTGTESGAEGAHEQARAAVAETLGSWRAAFDEHRTADIATLYTSDALFQGMDARLRIGPAQIREYYDAVTEGATVAVTVPAAAPVADGIVAGFADATFTYPDGEVRALRLSVVLRRDATTWRIAQYHAAPNPSAGH